MNLFYIIQKFLFARWKFKIFKKPILLYDGTGNSAENLSQIISRKKFDVFYNRGEEINLTILFLSILKNGFYKLKKNYKIEYIKQIKSKIVITFVDTNLGFFKLKKKFPQKIFIAFQSGIKGEDIIKNLNNNSKQSQKIDYYFVFSNHYAEILKKKINAKFYISGSFKANILSLKRTEKKDLIFISKQTNDHNYPVVYHELKILNILGNFCKKNDLNLDIILKHDLRKSYSDYLTKKKIFFSNVFYSNKPNSAYEICKDYKLIVNSDSTLGYEMLSLKKKVLFICYGSLESKQWLKKHHYPLKLTTFGYPSFVGKNRGSIWTNKLDEKYIKKLLSDNLFLRDLSWRKKNKSVIQKLIVRDEKNKKLLNLINLHLKK